MTLSLVTEAAMSSKEVQYISGMRLAEIRSGLGALKERRLPSFESEMLVASMWQMFRPAFDKYDDVVKSIQKMHQEHEETEDKEQKKVLMARIREYSEKLITQTFEVPVALSKIGQTNLPKVHKGKDGEDNSTGNASIIIALGTECFQFPELPETPTE